MASPAIAKGFVEPRGNDGLRPAMSMLSFATANSHNGTKSVAIGDAKDANFPVDGEGRVYHLGLKYGELANRVLIVGDPNRAELLSSFFDNPLKLYVRKSNRGFNTYTGRYKDVPVSVMSIGMGIPMIDFMVREARHVAKGQLAIVRLGTCGTPRSDLSVGSIVVAHSSRGVTTNYDAFGDSESTGTSADYYNITRPVPADKAMFDVLRDALDKQVLGRRVVACSDATADSFYSSQGRIDKNFADHNDTLIDDIVTLDPEVGSIQMETFHLYHLARLSGTISAAACAIVLAQRKKNDFLSNDDKHTLEKQAGRACFEALINWKVDEKELMDKDPVCVWNTPH
jgi:uridine phosphorylase